MHPLSLPEALIALASNSVSTTSSNPQTSARSYPTATPFALNNEQPSNTFADGFEPLPPILLEDGSLDYRHPFVRAANSMVKRLKRLSPEQNNEPPHQIRWERLLENSFSWNDYLDLPQEPCVECLATENLSKLRAESGVKYTQTFTHLLELYVLNKPQYAASTQSESNSTTDSKEKKERRSGTRIPDIVVAACSLAASAGDQNNESRIALLVCEIKGSYGSVVESASRLRDWNSKTGTGLCQAILYLLAAYEICGTTLAMVMVNQKWARIHLKVPDEAGEAESHVAGDSSHAFVQGVSGPVACSTGLNPPQLPPHMIAMSLVIEADSGFLQHIPAHTTLAEFLMAENLSGFLPQDLSDPHSPFGMNAASLIDLWTFCDTALSLIRPVSFLSGTLDRLHPLTGASASWSKPSPFDVDAESVEYVDHRRHKGKSKKPVGLSSERVDEAAREETDDENDDEGNGEKDPDGMKRGGSRPDRSGRDAGDKGGGNDGKMPRKGDRSKGGKQKNVSTGFQSDVAVNDEFADASTARLTTFSHDDFRLDQQKQPVKHSRQSTMTLSDASDRVITPASLTTHQDVRIVGGTDARPAVRRTSDPTGARHKVSAASRLSATRTRKSDPVPDQRSNSQTKATEHIISGPLVDWQQDWLTAVEEDTEEEFLDRATKAVHEAFLSIFGAQIRVQLVEPTEMNQSLGHS